MYSVIIVDDEEDVRRGIIGKVPWQACGFEVIGEAENGIEALELCEKEMPDLLITDVNMPYMNGLELLEELNRKRYPPYVLILTAYDEFGYAQKAVQFNASEYLLKPITSEELSTVLRRTKVKMDEEKAKRENIASLQRAFENNLAILREKYLSLLLTGKLNKRDVVEKAKAYGLDILLQKGCLVGIIMIDAKEMEKCIQAGLYCAEDKELIQFAVYNIANDIVNEYNSGINLLYGDSVILISLCEGDDIDTLTSQSLAIFDEIRQSVSKYLHLTITVGAGCPCADVWAIKDSYKDAVAACNYRILLGGNRVIYIKDVEPNSRQALEFDEMERLELSQTIRTGTIAEMEAMLDRLFEKATLLGSFTSEYQLYLLEIVTTVMKTAKSMKIDISERMGSSFADFVGVLKGEDVVELKAWVKQACSKVMQELAYSRMDANKMMVKAAKQYIYENYMDPDISLEKVCKHIHISASHFCTIFKKETNDTFNNYLHQFRMQNAKELLRTTDMKLREVAEKLGYSDPNYFSYSFKKTFGVSPREYRTKE